MRGGIPLDTISLRKMRLRGFCDECFYGDGPKKHKERERRTGREFMMFGDEGARGIGVGRRRSYPHIHNVLVSLPLGPSPSLPASFFSVRIYFDATASFWVRFIYDATGMNRGSALWLSERGERLVSTSSLLEITRVVFPHRGGMRGHTECGRKGSQEDHALCAEHMHVVQKDESPAG